MGRRRRRNGTKKEDACETFDISKTSKTSKSNLFSVICPKTKFPELICLPATSIFWTNAQPIFDFLKKTNSEGGGKNGRKIEFFAPKQGGTIANFFFPPFCGLFWLFLPFFWPFFGIFWPFFPFFPFFPFLPFLPFLALILLILVFYILSIRVEHLQCAANEKQLRQQVPSTPLETRFFATKVENAHFAQNCEKVPSALGELDFRQTNFTFYAF